MPVWMGLRCQPWQPQLLGIRLGVSIPSQLLTYFGAAKEVGSLYMVIKQEGMKNKLVRCIEINEACQSSGALSIIKYKVVTGENSKLKKG
jgi:hypothetical protein